MRDSGCVAFPFVWNGAVGADYGSTYTTNVTTGYSSVLQACPAAASGAGVTCGSGPDGCLTAAFTAQVTVVCPTDRSSPCAEETCTLNCEPQVRLTLHLSR